MTASDPTRRRLRRAPLPRFLASLLVGLLLAPPVVWAGPSGSNVVSGKASVVHDGSDTTVTAGNKSIIEWDNFDIGVDESVRFIQPNRRSRVLNRVVGPNATYIEGELRANGSVYILNQYGVYVGNTAVIDVAHLVAAAGHLSNADFLSGVDRFTELGGAVENLGEITGGSVTLLGKSVANHGTISATNGRIWMLAGDEVIVAEHGSPIILTVKIPSESELGSYAVVNTGNLDAGNRGAVRMAAGDLLSLAIHNTGTIRAREIELAGGENSRVQVGGTLDASNTIGGPVRDGGRIDIRGDYVFVDDATIDASGRRGGGTVHIGGDIAGALEPGSSERNSQITYISDDSVIRADALVTGDGGEVVAWSDGATFVDGKISARGAKRRGDGGFVETSGKKYLSADVVPDLSAPNGNGGTWLIDPADIEIVAAATVGDPNDLTHFVEDLAVSVLTTGSLGILPEIETSQIEANSLEAALGQGFNIVISTQLADASVGTQEGNILFSEALDFDSPNTIIPGTTASLTLLAANRIEFADLGGTTTTIDDSNSPNLALSLFFQAGDTGQAQAAGFVGFDDTAHPPSATSGAQQSIELRDGIDIKGSLDLNGQDIIADQRLRAESITITAEHAVRTAGLETNGRDIIIRSEGGDTEINGAGGAQADVVTAGGNFGITAIGGDIRLSGGVDLRTDLTDNSPDAEGGALAFVSIPVSVDDGRAPGTGGDGGNIFLTENNPTDQILAPSGVGMDAGDSLDIEQDVVTHRGAATFRVTDNLEIADLIEDDGNVVPDLELVLGDQSLTLRGDVISNGGLITVESTQAVENDPSVNDISVNVDIQGNLNALDTLDPTTHGDIAVATSGNVDIQPNAVISGDNVQVSAGLDGTGDLNFLGAATFNARSAAVEAGDGFSPTLQDDGTPDTAIDIADRLLRLDSQINGLSGVTMQGNNNDDLDTVLVLQDADLATSNLPTIDFGTSVKPSIEISSRDNSIHVETGIQAALPADTQLFLIAAGDNQTTAPPFQIDEQLDFDRVDLATAGSFVVDTALAGMMSGANTSELVVTAGLGGILPFDSTRQPEFEGVAGALVIEDNVVLAANDVLEVHGASNGVGGVVSGVDSGRGLQIGSNVTLQADDITVRAGDGVGGANFSTDSTNNSIFPAITNASGGAVTDLNIQNVGAGPLTFTYRQEAAIGPNDLPGVDDVNSVVHYRAISDEGNITFDDTTVVNEPGLLTGQDVTLAARDYDFDNLTVPIVTRSLDIGGITNFRVDDDLLSNFNWGSNELTLRAGTGRGFAGTLSFASGTTVSADTIRLVASDGLGFQGTSAINVGGATFTAADINVGDTDSGPTNFIMEQDADLDDGTLPSISDFGDGDGTRTPSTVALRSVDGGVLLDQLPNELVGAAGKLLLAGELVRVDVEDGDLDLSSIADLEIRADQVALRAVSSSDTDPLNYKVVFGANNKFFGYDIEDGGNEDGDLDLTPLNPTGSLAPEVFTVQQDDTIFSSALPDRALFGDAGPESNDATLYRLIAEQDAEIDVDSAARVQDTSLELRLADYDVDDALKRQIDLSSANTYFLQGLDISVPESLTLSDVDIDAIGLVRLEAGTLGVADGQGNLIFSGNNSIRATEIRLFAGGSGLVSIDATTDPDANPPDIIGKAGLAKVEIAAGGTLDLTLDEDDADLDTELTIVQDGDLLSSDVLPNGVTAVTPSKPADLLDRLTLVSRRGNLSVDIADVTETEALILSAGSDDVEVDDGVDFGTLEVFSQTGDLELGTGSTNQITDIQLSGEVVELRAESAGARLQLDEDDIQVFGGDSTLPTNVLLSQDAAFVTDATNLLQVGQFTGSPFGLEYELNSQSGDILVNDVMADQLSAFDLTLDNRNSASPNNKISLDSSLTGTQRFFGLHVKSADIEIGAGGALDFATLGVQKYEGPVTFLNSTDLTGLDVLFGDTVQADAPGVDVQIYSARRVQFAEGVGSSGGLNPLAAGNQLNDLSVYFLDQGEVEFGSSSPNSDPFDVGELSDALNDTSDTGVYLQGDLEVHTIEALDFVRNGLTTPTNRDPASNRATAYKRGVGTLRIEANNVQFGEVDLGTNGILDSTDTALSNGEKLTALGNLEIAALGNVVVGDLTAQNIQIDANSIGVIKRRGSGVRAPSGQIDGDAGVDWVANQFQLTTTDGLDQIVEVGRGQRLIVGTSGPRPTVNGVPLDAPLFAIKPTYSGLLPNELLYDGDGVDPGDGTFNASTVVLDGRPRGSSAADLSDAIPEPSPIPSTGAPHGDQVVAPNAFREVGIVARPATGREHASSAENRGIYDDASRAWRSDREVALLTSTRLDVPNASEAKLLFGEVFGSDMGKAEGIRTVLGKAVADYQTHTGVRRVLGFELRRYLKNRPSTQFDAYQILEGLDRLFSAHRRSGLVPGEYEPVQRAWVEAITPGGIAPDELEEAIQPSRYVRGSDVLDVFGD